MLINLFFVFIVKQGTGLEVLIFCAFSATFFLAACTVSLCKRPRDLNILPSITHDHVQNIDNTAIQVVQWDFIIYNFSYICLYIYIYIM